MSFNDIAIVSVKGNYFRIQFWYMSKAEAINLFKEILICLEEAGFY